MCIRDRTQIANLIASAPGTLDTLNELAEALNDDPNFATTMTNALATKITASSTDTLTNKSGNISQWTNNSNYITASTTDTLTNKSGAISQWTNDSNYLTSETSHADVVVDGDFASEGLIKRGGSSGSYSIITDNSSNWNTAYTHSQQAHAPSNAEQNVNADWSSSSGDSEILNKPNVQYTSAIPTITSTVGGLLSDANAVKFAGIATGAEVNVKSDWSAGSGDAEILNKPNVQYTSAIPEITATVGGLMSNADAVKFAGIATGANLYTHPTHPGDDISVDTTALTGATVISDLDFNVTTDVEGHVTDANGTVATRTLTLANLGYTGATNANYITNNNQLTNGANYTTYTANQAVDTSSSPTFNRITTGGLYGGVPATIVPIWQYNSGNPGYGIAYHEGNPDVLRVDVSGNLMSGTPDFLFESNQAKINGNIVLHAGNYSSYASASGHTHSIDDINTGTVTTSSIHTYLSNDDKTSTSGSQSP